MPDTWETALDAPGARQMSVLRRVFTGRQWWGLVPDQALFADQTNPGTTLTVQPALSVALGHWLS